MKKVLIVEDSRLMAKILKDSIEEIEGLKVVDVAENGEEALKIVEKKEVDLIFSDIVMPKMDGLEFIQRLMKVKKIPVIVISALTKQGADITIRALEAGAADFITKPSNIFSVSGDKFKMKLYEKVNMAFKIKLPELIKSNNFEVEHKFSKPAKKFEKLVVMGISTGGPRSLQLVIPKLEKNFPAAMLVVQHMPKGFTKSLAERLDSLSEIKVKEAEDGDVLKPGVVYIAPGGFHTEVFKENDKYVVRLNSNPPIGGLRPCADIAMESISKLDIRKITGVVMTGMGSDATKGLKMLKEKNDAYIIAQDEATSIVYGMPRAAKEAGIVDEIVSLDRIPNAITTNIGGR